MTLGGDSAASGPPLHPDWVRRVRDDCAAAGVPFDFKQWGAYAPCEHFPGIRKPGPVVQLGCGDSVHGGAMMTRVGKKLAGRVLDGRVHDAVPAAWRLTSNAECGVMNEPEN